MKKEEVDSLIKEIEEAKEIIKKGSLEETLYEVKTFRGLNPQQQKILYAKMMDVEDRHKKHLDYIFLLAKKNILAIVQNFLENEIELYNSINEGSKENNKE